MEALDVLLDELLMLDQGRFRDLDRNLVVGDPVAGEDVVDALVEIGDGQVVSRHVHRQRREIAAGRPGIPDVARDLSDDLEVQLPDPMVLL